MVFNLLLLGLMLIGCGWLTLAWWKCYRHTQHVRARNNLIVWPFIAIMMIGLLIIFPDADFLAFLMLTILVWFMILLAFLNKEKIVGYRTSRDFILLRQPDKRTIDQAQGLYVPDAEPDLSIRGNKWLIIGFIGIIIVITTLQIVLD